MVDLKFKMIRFNIFIKGIAKRSFEQKFRLEQYVDVKDAKLSNGLLTISLVREIPEERKPRQITLKSA